MVNDINETLGTILTSGTLTHFAGRNVMVTNTLPASRGMVVTFKQVVPEGFWPEKALRLTEAETAETPPLFTSKVYELSANAPFFKKLS